MNRKSRQEKMASFLGKDKPANNNNNNNSEKPVRKNMTSKKRVPSKKEKVHQQPVAHTHTRSENRQVLCFFDPSSSKIKGVFLDAGHASHVLGIDVQDIKNDIAKGTEKTGGVWIKAPVGATVNHREIQKVARQMYKEMKGVTAGRKPNVPREETIQKINALDFSKMDDRAFRKINRLLTALETGPKKRKARTTKKKSEKNHN